MCGICGKSNHTTNYFYFHAIPYMVLVYWSELGKLSISTTLWPLTSLLICPCVVALLKIIIKQSHEVMKVWPVYRMWRHSHADRFLEEFAIMDSGF